MDSTEIVRTGSGRVRGYKAGRVVAFKGIPYAVPPVGPNRFLPPQSVKPWGHILDASKFGPIVPQPLLPAALSVLNAETPQDESACLTLNVWTPRTDDAKRPVMFWIHGGALSMGSGAEYDGQKLAERGNVVVVTINYRLGPLGFLYVPGKTANVGFLDQVEALKWVSRNIGYFGGNPSDVTIFGESAGGLSVSAVMSMPKAKGLFKRVIIESNVCNPDCAKPENGIAVGQRLFSLLRLRYADMEALRSVDVGKLLAAYQSATATPRFLDTYPPFVDGDVLPIHPYAAVKMGAARDIDVMAGTNENEASLETVIYPSAPAMDYEAMKNRIRYFRKDTGETEAVVERFFRTYTSETEAAPFDTTVHSWERFETDHSFRIPVMRYLDAQSKFESKTYAYLFSWKTPELGGKLGATHALEIPFVNGTLGEKAYGIFPKRTEETDKVSFGMMDSWINFARRGDPNHRGIPDWPRYNSRTKPTMIFDREMRVQRNLFTKRNQAWKGIA